MAVRASSMAGPAPPQGAGALSRPQVSLLLALVVDIDSGSQIIVSERQNSVNLVSNGYLSARRRNRKTLICMHICARIGGRAASRESFVLRLSNSSGPCVLPYR